MITSHHRLYPSCENILLRGREMFSATGNVFRNKLIGYVALYFPRAKLSGRVV
jgi:hypothetical protein